MAVEDRIMRNMLSNEDLDRMVDKYQEGGLVKKSLVPMPGEEGTELVDPQMAASAEAASDRWGVDTPMFESREDMHGFLQDLGMAPGGFGADMLDAMLYMTEGELVNAMISMGAALPILGMGVTTGRRAKRFKQYIDKGELKYGGKVQRAERFKHNLKRLAARDKAKHRIQMQKNQAKLEQRQASFEKMKGKRESLITKTERKQIAAIDFEAKAKSSQVIRDVAMEAEKLPMERFIKHVERHFPKAHQDAQGGTIALAKKYRELYVSRKLAKNRKITWKEAHDHENLSFGNKNMPGGISAKKAMNIRDNLSEGFEQFTRSPAGKYAPKETIATAAIAPVLGTILDSRESEIIEDELRGMGRAKQY